MGPLSSKRHVLAEHLKEVIDTMEQKVRCSLLSRVLLVLISLLGDRQIRSRALLKSWWFVTSLIWRLSSRLLELRKPG